MSSYPAIITSSKEVVNFSSTPKYSKPVLGEINENNLDDILEVMPNPDIILQKAGIANEVYQEMMYDSDVFPAYQKRKKSIQRLNYKIDGKDKKAIKLIEETLKNIDFTKLTSGLLKALALVML